MMRLLLLGVTSTCLKQEDFIVVCSSRASFFTSSMKIQWYCEGMDLTLLSVGYKKW